MPFELIGVEARIAPPQTVVIFKHRKLLAGEGQSLWKSHFVLTPCLWRKV
jgi:hypothetical protein